MLILSLAARLAPNGLSLLKGVARKAHGDSRHGLEGVGHGVNNRGLGRGIGGKRQRGDFLDNHGELSSKDFGSDVKDFGRVETSVVANLQDPDSVGERTDVQLGQDGSLGGSDLVTSLDQVHHVGDLDLTLDNLGGDLQDLEEGGLSRVATGGTGRDGDIFRSEGTDTGRGRHAVGKNQLADSSEVFVGEDEPGVAAHAGIKLGEVVTRVSLDEISQYLAHHGVLTHEDLGLSTHLQTSLIHLVRTDVVNVHDEHLGVSGKNFLHAREVSRFLFLRDGHLERVELVLELEVIQIGLESVIDVQSIMVSCTD